MNRLRAFGSQLLCEQVVGRGLRRLDYVPEPETGLLTEEYVDIYGVPFSLIPFRGRPPKAPPPDDRLRFHVHALPERAHMRIRFPVVEGYAFALRTGAIKADVAGIEPLALDPVEAPQAVFVTPQVGMRTGPPSLVGRTTPADAAAGDRPEEQVPHPLGEVHDREQRRQPARLRGRERVEAAQTVEHEPRAEARGGIHV